MPSEPPSAHPVRPGTMADVSTTVSSVSPHPSAGLRMSRREVLRGSGVAVAAVVSTSVLAACAGGDDSDVPVPDPLLAEAVRARSDSATATAAIAFFPQSADVLAVVAAERTAHADAMTAEIARLTPPPTATEPAPAQPTEAPTATVPPPAALGDLTSALTESSNRAVTLARTLSGYRAGLLGSIGAACVLAAEAIDA